MRKLTGFLAILALLVLVVAVLAGRAAPAGAAWPAAVDPWVLETAAANGETEFLVFLAEQADLSAAATLQTKEEKGAYVYQQLTETAARTQPAVTVALEAFQVEYKPYWIANMLWVRGDLAVVQAMAERPDVTHVYANPWVHFDEPTPAEEIDNPLPIEWNILQVNADEVWAMGYTGQGAVIGGQDTGYDWDHPALQGKYRGWNGSTADHNYNWHDSIHGNNPNTPPGNPCGFDVTAPCDDHGHGTHTVGTMVGDDGGSNQIGMAPGAKWIGCRNMEEGWGTPTTYSECYQWFIAPTDLNGQNPDTTKAPHIISNSWGCPVIEGCTDPNVLLTVVQNVRAAGILTAHSAGNDGSSCSTVNTPAGIYDESFSVGATDSGDNIAGFSSRGPVTVDGSNRLKPDISAPGVSVRSSLPGTGYGPLSGTSMASPHVAGLTALILSAAPSLAGDVDLLEQIMEESALPRTTAQICGGIPGSQIPNNTYGYGRIDALAAVQSLTSFELNNQAPAQVTAGNLLTYTISISYVSALSPTSNVVLTDVVPVGTIFVTASLPFTQNGPEIRWDFSSMNPGDTQTVQLVVSVPVTATGTIFNDKYGVRSDNVATILGPPVETEIVPIDNNSYIYLPAVRRD